MLSRPPRSDAAHLRVLAHPTRLRLLGLLRERGPQTAAMLATDVDEAPGTLSYHLGRLAAAGYIHEEERPGDRRARWWAASHPATVWDHAELSADPDDFAASREMYRVVMQEYARRFDAYLAATPSLDEAWVRAALSTDRMLRLTAAQLQELRDDLLAMTAKWQAVSNAAGADAAPVSNAAGAEAAPVSDIAEADAAPVTVVLQAYRSVP